MYPGVKCSSRRRSSNIQLLFCAELEMIRKFAQLEFRHGSVERGKTLFENMVTTYPRRTDIWSVYIGVCIKFGDIDQARFRRRLLILCVCRLKAHSLAHSLAGWHFQTYLIPLFGQICWELFENVMAAQFFRLTVCRSHWLHH